MTAPATVPLLNASWAATLSGRGLIYFSSASLSSTERHAIFYGNGRVDSSYEYFFSDPVNGGQVYRHDDYYGQWWVQNSWQDQGGTYLAEVTVYWYDSTDHRPRARLTSTRLARRMAQIFGLTARSMARASARTRRARPVTCRIAPTSRPWARRCRARTAMTP
jgi:hypothetical protein